MGLIWNSVEKILSFLSNMMRTLNNWQLLLLPFVTICKLDVKQQCSSKVCVLWPSQRSTVQVSSSRWRKNLDDAHREIHNWELQRNFLPQQRQEECGNIAPTSVCLLFLPKMNVLVSFFINEKSRRHLSFLAPHPSVLSFRCVDLSLRSDQLRFQVSSKIIIVIYNGDGGFRVKTRSSHTSYLVFSSWICFIFELFDIQYFSVRPKISYQTQICFKVIQFISLFIFPLELSV